MILISAVQRRHLTTLNTTGMTRAQSIRELLIHIVCWLQ